MPKLKNVVRIFVVLMLTLGLTASTVGATSAQAVTGDAAGGVHAALDTDEIVQQLIEVLKNILSEILGGGLATLLPEECSVTLSGFACTLNIGDTLDGVDCNFDISEHGSFGTCVVDGIARGCQSTVVGTTITLQCASVTMGFP